MKLGIQLYSVRDDAARDLPGTLRQLAEMGYDGVELAGLYGKTAEEVRDLAQEVGLTIISAHVGLAEFRQGIPETVARYRTAGCRYIAIPHLAAEDRPDGENFPQVMQEIAAIAEECAKQGLTLLYHNHDFEFAKLPDGRTELEALYACAPETLLQTEIDVCWVNIVGEDPAALLRKYTGRAPLVHLKDSVGDRSAEHYESLGIDHRPAPDAVPFSFRPVGSGVVNIPAVVEAAKDAGASWLIVEEDEPAEGQTALESARISAQYARSVM